MRLKLLMIVLLMFGTGTGLHAAAMAPPCRAAEADSHSFSEAMTRREVKKRAGSDTHTRQIRKGREKGKSAFVLGIISWLISAVGAVGMLAATRGTFLFGLSLGVAGLGVLGLVISFFMMLMLLGFLLS